MSRTRCSTSTTTSAARLDAEIVDPDPHATVEAAAAAMGFLPIRSSSDPVRNSRRPLRDGDRLRRARVDARGSRRSPDCRGCGCAPPDVVLRVTGYPAGGTPPIGTASASGGGGPPRRRSARGDTPAAAARLLVESAPPTS